MVEGYALDSHSYYIAIRLFICLRNLLPNAARLEAKPLQLLFNSRPASIKITMIANTQRPCRSSK